MSYTPTTGYRMITGLKMELQRVNYEDDSLDIDQNEEGLHAALEVEVEGEIRLIEVHYSLIDDCGLLTMVEHRWDGETGRLEPMYPRIMSLEKFSDWVTDLEEF